jgi:hypothetical protein
MPDAGPFKGDPMMRLFTALCLIGTLAAAAQAPRAAKKPAAPVASAPKVAPKAAAFVGNKATKTFHRADCALAAKMKEANRVTFATAAEAAKAGYKPCKVCKPQ